MKMSEIIDMRTNGATYQEIADAVGLSKQRVRTIIINHSPELKGTRGSALRRANDQVNRQQAEIEQYKGVIKLLENDVLTAKAEAVKEFAERLKEGEAYIIGRSPSVNKDFEFKRYVVFSDDIDHLAKEMTEQSVNYGSSKTEGNG